MCVLSAVSTLETLFAPDTARFGNIPQSAASISIFSVQKIVAMKLNNLFVLCAEPPHSWAVVMGSNLQLKIEHFWVREFLGSNDDVLHSIFAQSAVCSAPWRCRYCRYCRYWPSEPENTFNKSVNSRLKNLHLSANETPASGIGLQLRGVKSGRLCSAVCTV